MSACENSFSKNLCREQPARFLEFFWLQLIVVAVSHCWHSSRLNFESLEGMWQNTYFNISCTCYKQHLLHIQELLSDQSVSHINTCNDGFHNSIPNRVTISPSTDKTSSFHVFPTHVPYISPESNVGSRSVPCMFTITFKQWWFTQLSLLHSGVSGSLILVNL